MVVPGNGNMMELDHITGLYVLTKKRKKKEGRKKERMKYLFGGRGRFFCFVPTEIKFQISRSIKGKILSTLTKVMGTIRNEEMEIR